MSLSLFVGPDLDDPAASGVVSQSFGLIHGPKTAGGRSDSTSPGQEKKTTVGSFLSLAYDRLAGGSSEREMTPKACKKSPISNTHARKRPFRVACVLVS